MRISKTSKRFYLHPENIPEGKSQGKTFFRRAARGDKKRGGRTKKENFFGSRIVGAKATLGCFSQVFE